MGAVAICIHCGAVKKRPPARCGRCGFTPRTDEEKAKSFILSTSYEIDGDLKARSAAELLAIGDRIAAGEHAFDEREVRGVAAAARAALGVPTRKMLFELARWLAPVGVLVCLLAWFAVREYGK